MKRLSTALGAALLMMFGVFAAGGTASAEPYVTAPSLTIVGCADTINGTQVQITGLLPGSRVTIKWKNPSGSVRATADANGDVTATLRIKRAGDYTVTADGTAADGTAWSASVPVTVNADCGALGGVGDDDNATGGDSDATGGQSDESAAGGLADTGAAGNQGMLLALGVGALLVGGMTVLISRHRRWGSSDKA
jgi:hypothetical protein